MQQNEYSDANAIVMVTCLGSSILHINETGLTMIALTVNSTNPACYYNTVKTGHEMLFIIKD